MIRSPISISGCSAPLEPMRMNVAASVISITSASTISTLSGPIPVDMAEIRWPRYVPVAVVISRLLRRSSTLSQRSATLATRPGSPTSRMYSASSPRSRAMWYWRLPSRGASARERSVKGSAAPAFERGASNRREYTLLLVLVDRVEGHYPEAWQQLISPDAGLRLSVGVTAHRLRLRLQPSPSPGQQPSDERHTERPAQKSRRPRRLIGGRLPGVGNGCGARGSGGRRREDNEGQMAIAPRRARSA